ncbi:MAG: pyridoxamine 5'-phosphate oxidase family protein [Terracidiphilus sp.]|jgi:predicted pyridoxine 5'-phosphate oxidase superfamily flavin-nucleotide-binding protein
MGRRFAELAFTQLVKQHQKLRGSRHIYEKVERSADAGDRLGPHEKSFIRECDGFYMASVSETGWPYIQHRGGEKGFLHVLDAQTIGFADLRGNTQYISVGNFHHDDRVALFFMDYPHQRRLKILGRVKILEGDADAQKTIETLRVPGEKSLAERALIIHVEAFDWNCPQHITPRYTEEELTEILEPMRRRLDALEAENKRLRAASPQREIPIPATIDK